MLNTKYVIVSVLLAAIITASNARAFEHRPGYHEEHRDDRRGFRHGDSPWHQGHWIHDRHGGRLGWWWVVGPAWHYYPRQFAEPRTVIIEQAPPPPAQLPVTTIAQAPLPPATPTLYYCKATGTYYPDTMTCPGGWSTQVAGAPPTP